MLLRRFCQRVLLPVLLLAAASLAAFNGGPIAQRIEEYMLFIAASELKHADLLETRTHLPASRAGVKTHERQSHEDAP